MKRRRHTPKVKSVVGAKRRAMQQRASKGSAYVGPRQMFEDIARDLYEQVTLDPKAKGGTPPPTWEDVQEFAEDGEVGVFVRSEPVGTGYAVTMRVARPSEIRSGVFYARLAAQDQERGIAVFDGERPVAVKVMPLAEVGEMRRMMREAAAGGSEDSVPLDDFTVNGEVGVVMYSEPMPGIEGPDSMRVELRYVTPAEARAVARQWGAQA
jgi:hypothetical protein